MVSSTDYYAFGAPMPGRNFNSNGYRYGFNGKENDNEVSGNGNSYDYGERMYNPRIGRPFTVDPLFRYYPGLSTYQFFSNNPIRNIDLDGMEGVPAEKNAYGVSTTAKSSTYVVTKTEAEINQMKQVAKVNNYYTPPPPATVSQGGLLATPEYKMFAYNMDLYGDWVLPLSEVKKLMAGEELTYAEMGIAGLSFIPGGKIFGKAGKLLKGTGGDVLEQFVAKFEKQAGHLTEKDLAGAVKDIFGAPVKIGEKTYQHQKEVEEALSGVGKKLGELSRVC